MFIFIGHDCSTAECHELCETRISATYTNIPGVDESLSEWESTQRNVNTRTPVNSQANGRKLTLRNGTWRWSKDMQLNLSVGRRFSTATVSARVASLNGSPTYYRHTHSDMTGVSRVHHRQTVTVPWIHFCRAGRRYSVRSSPTENIQLFSTERWADDSERNVTRRHAIFTSTLCELGGDTKRQNEPSTSATHATV